jgi:hypothetical protein
VASRAAHLVSGRSREGPLSAAGSAMGVKAAPRFFLSNEWKIRKEKGEKSSPLRLSFPHIFAFGFSTHCLGKSFHGHGGPRCRRRPLAQAAVHEVSCPRSRGARSRGQGWPRTNASAAASLPRKRRPPLPRPRCLGCLSRQTWCGTTRGRLRSRAGEPCSRCVDA